MARGSWPTRRKLDGAGRMRRTFKCDGRGTLTIDLVGEGPTGRGGPFLAVRDKNGTAGIMWDRRRLRAMAEGVLRMLDSLDGNP